jgi:hypothetical protein
VSEGASPLEGIQRTLLKDILWQSPSEGTLFRNLPFGINLLWKEFPLEGTSPLEGISFEGTSFRRNIPHLHNGIAPLQQQQVVHSEGQQCKKCASLRPEQQQNVAAGHGVVHVGKEGAETTI